MIQPPLGAFIRITKPTFGSRISKMYTHIAVPAGTLAVVIEHCSNPKFGNFRVATLKYVKSRKRWEQTKVLAFLSFGDVFSPTIWEPVGSLTL